jgi:hypothetical protein
VTIPPIDRPQAARNIPVPHHVAVVGPPAAATFLHRRIHIRHQTHTRPGERGSGRLEPPGFSNPRRPPLSQLPSPALTAEDWLEEGLAALDRPILAAIADAQPVDFLAMAAAQRACPEVAEMINSSTLQIRTQAVGDVSTGVFRPLVPIQHREAVFHSIHPLGLQATCRLIAARFCWPLLAKAITQMARACLQCQRGKVHRHVHLQPTEIPVPHHHFAHLHVDLVGPLPPSRGHTYLFTIIDWTSRWPEAIPLASITTADCTRAPPATITSDRGAQFTSALWAGLCSLPNIQHSPTTAYNPQSNGFVERFHRWLKDALRSWAAAADWHDHLPWVLLGIRTAFRFPLSAFRFHGRRRCTARATGRPLRGGFAGSVSTDVWAAFRRRVDTLSVLSPISSRKK